MHGRSSKAKVGRRSFLAGLGSLILASSIPDTSSNSAAAEQGASQGLSTGRFGDIDESTIFDVCIIGSGFAGAILGATLVKRGIKTVILESGPDTRERPIDARFEQLQSFRSSGPIDYPVTSSRFRGTGGTSWLWGGFSTRLDPIDFEKNSYTPVDNSWPITYAQLEPYYEQAEKILRVRGETESEHDPPRRTRFPLPADRKLSPLQSLLKKAGITVSDVPFSTPAAHGSSILSGRYGPFLRMTESHLPAFQRSSYGTLIPEVTASRLLVDQRGHVSGAEIKNLDRSVKRLRARAYVIACGGLESPRLLLLSRAPAFPNGIGNNHGWVGRCFMEHRKTLYAGQVGVEWNSFNLYQLTGFSYQFYKRFKRQGWGGMRLRFHLDGFARWNQIYEGDLGKIFDRVTQRRLEISYGAEMKPSPENRVTLDGKAKDYFGNPLGNLSLKHSVDDLTTMDRGNEVILHIYHRLGARNVKAIPGSFWGHHHTGTCRMGDNPRTGVVDRNLRVHGTSNLFVAGSSVFVTSGSANPTLTLSALSLRLSEHLGAELRSGEFGRSNN